MKTILLKFKGPLQSWGTDSRFETRSTDRYPSKSAVIGLVAACFGYSREDARIEKFNQLDFAVRVDQPGELLNDYHTAQKYNARGIRERTYVTNRHYLQDAVFVVALGSNDNEWITKIEQALKSPYYQPFLGRRSNPLTADFFLGTLNKDVIASLEELDWQASDWYKRKKSCEVNLSIYADAHLIEDSPKQMVRDQVITFSQKERLHGYRAVGWKEIALRPSYVGDDHDAFNAF